MLNKEDIEFEIMNIEADIEITKVKLVDRMSSLSRALSYKVKEIEEADKTNSKKYSLNSTGEVQGNGIIIDSLCSKLMTLQQYKENFVRLLKKLEEE